MFCDVGGGQCQPETCPDSKAERALSAGLGQPHPESQAASVKEVPASLEVTAVIPFGLKSFWGEDWEGMEE